jgi:hypothetical protein
VVYSLGAEADAQRKWKLLLGRGRGDNVAATLNPAAGRGLTHLLRHGCALHQRAAGSGVGVSLRGGGRLHAAAAHLVSGAFLCVPSGICCAICLWSVESNSVVLQSAPACTQHNPLECTLVDCLHELYTIMYTLSLAR